MDKNSKNTSTEFLFRLFAYLGFLFNDCNAILSFIFWNRKNDYLIFIEKNGWKKIVKLQWPFLVDLNPEHLHRWLDLQFYKFQEINLTSSDKKISMVEPF